MKRSHTLLAALFAASLTSCVWRSNEEATQLEERCTMHFIGNTAGAHVAITGEQGYSFDIDAGSGIRYAILPGNYRVTVTKADRVVVDRRIFVAAGETREVRIP